jgi:hypothetical protein
MTSINTIVDGDAGDLTFDSLTVPGDIISTKGMVEASVGDIRSGKDVTAVRHLTAGGNSTIGGNETISGDLTVGGDASIGGDLSVTGEVTGATANITGEAAVGSINSSGAIAGTAITGDSLDVTGEVKGTALNITGDATISGDAEIDGDGRFGGCLRAVACYFGRGIAIRESSPAKTLTYDIGATFTASTFTIAKAGQTFVSDGIVAGDMMIVTAASNSDYVGAVAEVLSVAEESFVISVSSSGSHTPDDLTGLNFLIHNHPLFYVLDHGDAHFLIGPNADASFSVHAEISNNDHAIHYTVKAGRDGHHAMELDYDPDTFSGNAGFRMNVDATAMDAAADRLNLHSGVVDNTGATGGQVYAQNLSVADPTNSNLDVRAILANEGVGIAHQHIGTAASLAAGFSYTGTTYTDRTVAFGSAGTNVQLFGVLNDYIYIAAADKFDEIIVALATPSSHNIIPTFEYVTDAGGWVSFVPVDSTTGFTLNGSIRFTSADLTTWGVRTINEVTGAVGADDYYWIRIRRTRNILPTPPTESTIKILTRATDFNWDKSGDVNINTIAVTDGVTAPDPVVGRAFIYVDTADGDLKIKFGDGTIKTIATD